MNRIPSTSESVRQLCAPYSVRSVVCAMKSSLQLLESSHEVCLDYAREARTPQEREQWLKDGRSERRRYRILKTFARRLRRFSGAA